MCIYIIVGIIYTYTAQNILYLCHSKVINKMICVKGGIKWELYRNKQNNYSCTCLPVSFNLCHIPYSTRSDRKIVLSLMNS